MIPYFYVRFLISLISCCLLIILLIWPSPSFLFFLPSFIFLTSFYFLIFCLSLLSFHYLLKTSSFSPMLCSISYFCFLTASLLVFAKSLLLVLTVFSTLVCENNYATRGINDLIKTFPLYTWFPIIHFM